MKFPKSPRPILALGAVILLSILYIQIMSGTFIENTIEIMLTFVIIFVSVLMATLLTNKLKPWLRASHVELEREDSAFIEGIGFLQATLLLFVINYMEEGLLSLFLSVSIVFVTVVFYVYRAYAHIQNDSHWRWKSIEVLMVAVMLEGGAIVSVLFNEFLDLLLPDWLNVPSISFMPLFFLIFIYSDLRTRFYVRYDLPS